MHCFIERLILEGIFTIRQGLHCTFIWTWISAIVRALTQKMPNDYHRATPCLTIVWTIRRLARLSTVFWLAPFFVGLIRPIVKSSLVWWIDRWWWMRWWLGFHCPLESSSPGSFNTCGRRLLFFLFLWYRYCAWHAQSISHSVCGPVSLGEIWKIVCKLSFRVYYASHPKRPITLALSKLKAVKEYWKRKFSAPVMSICPYQLDNASHSENNKNKSKCYQHPCNFHNWQAK